MQYCEQAVSEMPCFFNQFNQWWCLQNRQSIMSNSNRWKWNGD